MKYINTIKLTHKKQPLNGYDYEYNPNCHPLLMTIAYQLTTYIGYSDRYKNSLNNKPFVYHVNASIMERVDNYIVFGFDFGPFQGYISSERFTNLMAQWEKAFRAQPEEISLTIDEEMNFTIAYQTSTSSSIHKNNLLHTQQNFIISKDNRDNQNPWFISTQDQFVEIELENEIYYADSQNEKLLMFAELLISLRNSVCLEKLTTKPFGYYDSRYSLTVIQDKIFVYDKIMKLKALPPLENFLDLMHEWQSTIKLKPELIRLYIDDNYNFRILILEPVS